MSYNFTGVSVLLAEDIKLMQELTGYALNSLGIKNVLKAADGARAYELFKAHQPDLIICDWQMKPMNGLDLVKTIRRDRQSIMRSVPIIMVTGYASEDYVKRARDAGVNEFLVKPFTAEALASRIGAIIEKPRSYVESMNYFGPDRRRKMMTRVYHGPLRRHGDDADEEGWSVDI